MTEHTATLQLSGSLSAEVAIRLGEHNLGELIQSLQSEIVQMKAQKAAEDAEKASLIEGMQKRISQLEAETHNKEHLDKELAKKADHDTIERRVSFVEGELGNKAHKEHVDTQLAKKADLNQLGSLVCDEGKSHKDHLQAAVEPKVDKHHHDHTTAQLEKKIEDVHNLLKRKADSEHVNAELAKRASKEHVDAALGQKADRSSMNDALSKQKAESDAAAKARAAQVDAELAKARSNREAMEKELANKTGKDFLAAQLAGLSDAAQKTNKEIEAIVKEDIDFEPSSAKLTRSAMNLLNKVAPVLKKSPGLKMQVEGHTGCKCPMDGKKSKCKAVELANSRATSVMEHLKNAGCTNAMSPTGHGCRYRVGMAVKIFPAGGQ